MSIAGFDNMMNILDDLQERPEYKKWRKALMLNEENLTTDAVRNLTVAFSALDDDPDNSAIVKNIEEVINSSCGSDYSSEDGDEDEEDYEDDYEDEDEDEYENEDEPVADPSGCEVIREEEEEEKKPIETEPPSGVEPIYYDENGNELPSLIYKHEENSLLPKLTQNGWIFNLG